MAGDTPKEDETTEVKLKDGETPKVVEPPEIFLAAAGGGLIGGVIGAIVGAYLTGG